MHINVCVWGGVFAVIPPIYVLTCVKQKKKTKESSSLSVSPSSLASPIRDGGPAALSLSPARKSQSKAKTKTREVSVMTDQLRSHEQGKVVAYCLGKVKTRMLEGNRLTSMRAKAFPFLECAVTFVCECRRLFCLRDIKLASRM